MMEDQLITNQGSAALKEQFDLYHDWCWCHGYGDCDICKKVFNKYYIPIRKRELQVKLRLIDAD